MTAIKTSWRALVLPSTAPNEMSTAAAAKSADSILQHTRAAETASEGGRDRRRHRAAEIDGVTGRPRHVTGRLRPRHRRPIRRHRAAETTSQGRPTYHVTRL